MNIVKLIEHKPDSYSNLLETKSILLFLVIIFTIATIFRQVYFQVIILVVFAGFLVDKYIGIQYDTITDINVTIMSKLDNLQLKMYDYVELNILEKHIKVTQNDILEMKKSVQLDALYINADIIDFLDSISSLNDFNQHQFYKLLKGTNNIMRMRRDAEKYFKANKSYPENIQDMFRVSLNLKTKCLNNLQNFIYTIPKNNTFFQYLSDLTETFNTLVTRDIDKLYYYTIDDIKTRGITCSTVFPEYHPKYKMLKPSSSVIVGNFYV